MRGSESKARERHNSSADEKIIDKGACGQTHLATGRACIRAVGHTGTCDFRPSEEAQAVADGLAEPLPS